MAENLAVQVSGNSQQNLRPRSGRPHRDPERGGQELPGLASGCVGVTPKPDQGGRETRHSVHVLLR